jgi:tetratricopeptide (TPR) repeat protein
MYFRAAMLNCSLFFGLALTSACSSVTPLHSNDTGIADERLLNVPFYAQDDFHCGPAALAGLLQYFGEDYSPATIANWVYVPERRGSFQLEMVAAIRRAGFIAYPLDGEIKNILAEVNAGNPVLVLQNLGLSWWPQWHYATVVGYDINRQKMVLNSGSIKNYKVSAGTFARTWMRAGSWAIVAMPPDRIPVTSTPIRFLNAATDFESLAQPTVAQSAYAAALKRWPNNTVALMGLGNTYYAVEDFARSVDSFLTLVEHDPDNAMAWNNLAYAYRELGCPDKARSSIATAQALMPDDLEIAASYAEIIAADTEHRSIQCDH